MSFEEYVAARGVALVRLARLLTGDDHYCRTTRQALVRAAADALTGKEVIT